MEWKGYNENGNIKYELINGNGKVTEYFLDYGKLRFEGEYLNGKKNGQTKEYDIYGNLLFEGDYLNEKRNEKGKQYDSNGNLMFVGEYLDGKRKRDIQI